VARSFLPFKQFFSADNLRVSRILSLDPTALALGISPVLPLRNDALQILSAGKVKQALAVFLDMIQVKRAEARTWRLISRKGFRMFASKGRVEAPD
jgi:hypothetical protein